MAEPLVDEIAAADHFAPDNPNPLRDFFCYPSDGCQNPRQFTPITLQYSPACTSTQPPNGCGATECNTQEQRASAAPRVS
jgi:hypothetical protein